MEGKLKHYIKSMRLRTLPLSIAGVLLSSSLAVAGGYHKYGVFIAALITTLCLQILSNISNELGDFKKGTDSESRLGPIRSVQSGKLTYTNLLHAMYVFVCLSIVSGAMLVYASFHTLWSKQAVIMLLLGAGAIVAAIKYTFGKKSYGYVGLGDFFVFVFFGIVSVCGVYFLASGNIFATLLLPASSVGFLSVAVLNVNNLRDVKNDMEYSKKTVVVRMGEKKARIYHLLLILSAFITMTIYCTINQFRESAYLYLLTVPLYGYHLKRIFTSTGKELDSQLKFLSISTLFFALLAGVGIMLAV